MPYELEYIDFAAKPAWLLEASGGKVPVLKRAGSGLVMPDSDAIVLHLEEAFPEPRMVSAVPAHVGANLFPLFKAFLFAEPTELEEKRAAFVATLEGVDAWLAAHDGPFFGGASLDATDAALAPKLYHAAVALRHYRGLDVAAACPAVAGYLAAVAQHPAWRCVDYGAAAIIASWSHKH